MKSIESMIELKRKSENELFLSYEENIENPTQF